MARARDRWSGFREHIEKLGKKDLLPEEAPNAPPPSADAIIGILFRLSPDLAAADEHLDALPPDADKARARLEKLKETKDPYLADYARLLTARCDLLKKDYRAAAEGFESVLVSKHNLAGAQTRRALAECYRGKGETTLEILELRFLMAGLAPEAAEDRGWAESRLAEIRRDHQGPLHDSAKRMEDISGKLTADGGVEAAPGEQKKVEEILIKVAKLLEEEATRCPNCLSTACKACKKCGACTATGSCQGDNPGATCEVVVQGKGKGKGKGKGRPDGDQHGGPADHSKVDNEKPGEKKIHASEAKDTDVWGNVNEREVAKALQDLWGKIPPSYRQTVSHYFRDIAGLKSEAAPGK